MFLNQSVFQFDGGVNLDLIRDTMLQAGYTFYYMYDGMCYKVLSGAPDSYMSGEFDVTHYGRYDGMGVFHVVPSHPLIVAIS